MKTNHGDMPAMPVTLGENGGYQNSTHTWQHPGLTKRELFAAIAMQAIVTGVTGSVEVIQAVELVCKEKCIDTGAYIAKSAAEYADALLAELSKEPQE